MIRVKVEFESRNYAYSQVSFIEKNARSFEDFGIRLTSEDPHLVLCHHKMIGKNLSEHRLPIVAIERADAASVYNQSARDALGEDRVLLLLKSTILRSGPSNNLPVVQDRRHYAMINEESRLDPEYLPSPIAPDQASKIVAGIPLCIQEFFRPLMSREPDWDSARDIDLAFIGTVHPQPQIRRHRELCLGRMREIGGLSVVAGDKPLPRDQWLDLLSRAKICVSPWGHGEFAYRDFEAIYSGCVLLKPDSSFVEMLPDLYASPHYIACRHDYSDLERKARPIVADWVSTKRMRQDARKLLVDAWDPQCCIRGIALKIKESYFKYLFRKII